MEKKSAGFLNIPSSMEDPFYRYKMPRLQLKVEGKGNGIKTNILNLVEVAKALRVPTEYPLKFLGHELGSQTIYKEKGKDVTTVINGTFNDDLFRTTLDKFIEKYVLCQKCKYPEMILLVRKGVISGRCNACGAKSDLDNTHKLAAFIIKNPPDNKSELKKAPADVKEKEIKKEVVEKAVTSKSKATKEKTKDVEEDKNDGVGSDDEKNKNSKVKNEDYNVDSKKISQAIEILRRTYEEITQENEKFAEQPGNIDKFLAILRGLNFESGMEDRLYYVIFNAIFDVNIAKEVQKNSSFLQILFKRIPLKDYELNLLLTLEHFLLDKHKDCSYEKYIPTILKFFYDEDLLTEDFLLAWEDGKYQPEKEKNFLYKKEIDEAFKEHAKQILTWLRNNAGEEEEEEEEQQQESSEQKN